MEKKTIGAFIAALRKSNGMTQQEVADRLNVSNKSVSRWECDECYPDLTLIPAIAEMFNVTADEILRGERISKADETAPKVVQKVDSQKKAMMSNTMRKYKTMSVVSFSLLIAAPVVLVLLEMAVWFYSGLGLVFGAILFIAAVAVEIAARSIARSAFPIKDDDGEYDKTAIALALKIESYFDFFFVLTIILAYVLSMFESGSFVMRLLSIFLPQQFEALLIMLLVFALIVLVYVISYLRNMEIYLHLKKMRSESLSRSLKKVNKAYAITIICLLASAGILLVVCMTVFTDGGMTEVKTTYKDSAEWKADFELYERYCEVRDNDGNYCFYDEGERVMNETEYDEYVASSPSGTGKDTDGITVVSDDTLVISYKYFWFQNVHSYSEEDMTFTYYVPNKNVDETAAQVTGVIFCALCFLSVGAALALMLHRTILIKYNRWK